MNQQSKFNLQEKPHKAQWEQAAEKYATNTGTKLCNVEDKMDSFIAGCNHAEDIFLNRMLDALLKKDQEIAKLTREKNET